MNRARGHRAGRRRRVIAGGSLFALVAAVAVAGLIFSGVTQAAPSDPTTVGADTVSSIALNGTRGTTITVAPGTDVSISANWSDAGNSSCPDCIDYLDVGFPGQATPAGCLENDIIDGGTVQTGSGTVDLGDVPSAPGMYDVVAKYDEEYNCGQLWNLGAGGVVIAEITVLGPPLATIDSPSDHQTYNLNQSVATSFSCSDPDGPGLTGCSDSNGSKSPGALDTSATGTFAYTVTATSSDGKTGTATIHYSVAGPPTATITSPADGNTYNLAAPVTTDFNCTDPTGTGIASCVDSSGGTSPGTLDTSKAGSFGYTVTATSNDGQSSTATIHYTVVGPPSAAIGSPADGQTFAIGQNVVTGFSCLEAANGPGIKSCVDSNGSVSPGALDTTSTGAFAYSVTATSSDGQVGTATIHYKVAAPPSATIASPADSQTYNVGQDVATSFSCQESADGPGITSCVDSNGSTTPGTLDTSKPGTFAYAVTATSGDGQVGTATIHYTVAAPPTSAIGSPADGQTYAVGQDVATGFTCAEGANGSGIASCLDSNGSTSPGALDTSKPGTFAYAVTATSGDGQAGTATIHYTVAGPPTAAIRSPADGQTYNLGATVGTSFSCSDGASAPGISSCLDSNGSASPGTLDTSSAGMFAYSVTATSGDGQSSTSTIHYTVLAPPSAAIGSPADGQTYNIGAIVPTSFSCSEAAGAPGISSCVDSNGVTSPGALDTSKAGSFAYTVTATSSDGQSSTSTIHYTVLGPPSAAIGSPADGQTYNMGAVVPTSFSCSDAAGAPGISSCVDSNGIPSPGALDTSAAGTFAYSVTATSTDGQTTTSTIHYTVLGPPSAAIGSPADGQTYNMGAVVPTSFSCSDAAGAPGISSCVDSNASTSPGALVTSSAGTFAYSVTATSTDGQTTTSTIHYTVLGPPSAAIGSPADGQTYRHGRGRPDELLVPGRGQCARHLELR